MPNYASYVFLDHGVKFVGTDHEFYILMNVVQQILIRGRSVTLTIIHHTPHIVEFETDDEARKFYDALVSRLERGK